MTERFLFLDTKSSQEGEFHELMETVRKQNANRENWIEHDTPEVIAGFVREEAQELKDAYDQGKSRVDIASEIGDVLYLTFKLCAQEGIDPRDALEMKIVRNSLKYPDTLNSHNGYTQGREMSRAIYKAMGGDEAFFDAFSKVLNDDNAPAGFIHPENVFAQRPVRSSK